ncbi:MAG: DUF1501 domain-containing protein [Candidatus Obscuribacter phosphatis]|uniref:DUF1501 domain-containing protein n=1 Tax=Candidatus Obscuribacter phosphatis TaxID=1906157 RepID=A0A8J7TMK6_9BACT|nr:DUF1501 domain-containing protein [Candidatus Obscuribacter phosphatis]
MPGSSETKNGKFERQDGALGQPVVGARTKVGNRARTSLTVDFGETENCLVVIFLRGGADTLNMLVPAFDDDYHRFRPNIGIAKSLPLPSSGPGALAYGLHPQLSALLPLYESGELSFVQAVGTDNLSGSHFEAQDQMEHGSTFKGGHVEPLSGGYLGRLLALSSGPLGPLSAVSIGTNVAESLRGAPSIAALSGIDEVVLEAPEAETAAVSATLAKLYGGCSNKDLAGAASSTLQMLERIKVLGLKQKQESLAKVNGSGIAQYPDSELGRGLRDLSSLLKAKVGLKVACIDSDGWDTHFVQGNEEGLQAGFIKDLGSSLRAFQDDLGPLRKKVTTIVLTEFGRRVYQNSSLGTDHGRGFAAIISGGANKGGRVIGAYPGLKEDPSLTLAPTGLSVLIDYRDFLFDVMKNTFALDEELASVIFPGNKYRQIL